MHLVGLVVFASFTIFCASMLYTINKKYTLKEAWGEYLFIGFMFLFYFSLSYSCLLDVLS